MTTIRDVAKRAGVSIAAVSRALNNYPDINADTKARILKVVEELRYYPKASARQLVTQRTHTIGVFYPSFDGQGLRQPFIAHVLDVFKNTMGDYGYDILLFSNTRAPFADFDMLDMVRYRDVDGVLLLGRPDESIHKLAEANVPLVGVDHTAQGVRTASVSSDNRRALHDLVCTLHANGYRDIAFAHGPLNMPVSVERLQGFYSGMGRMGLDIHPEWIVNGTFHFEGGERAAEQILASRKPPEIVVCASDGSAIGMMQRLIRAGLTIPNDIGVTGFDDVDACAYVYPQLTTIRQNKDLMGRTAAQVMVQLIDNKDGAPIHLTLPTELIVRQSTRPLVVAQENPEVLDTVLINSAT